MIVATAGHVDHGKTLLVKALTGIDADRLPEEKKRGMTIDLGFAYWPVGADTIIGFVDVPGHERFIHNMLCGVTGIDFVLLVVAADDGIMPQTREHLAIIDLLGVSRGMVAVTKADRVASDRIDAVTRDIAALLAHTKLAKAPILPVSAVTGSGIDAVKANLVQAACDTPATGSHGNFRLAIDRAFTIAGVGLVVTGTVFSGAVFQGDTVRVLCADRMARVRSIHAQNAAAKQGRTGERCALNLTGSDVGLALVQRGDWIVSSDAPKAALKLDARLRVLGSEPRPLAHWTPVHVHLGAADVTGRCALLEGAAIAPGESGLVQLILDRPIGGVRGDRVILRDQSAQRTIAGGAVIDIYPPRRGRSKPERLAYLRAMELADHAAALTALLDGAPQGLELEKFAGNRNLTLREANDLFVSHALRIVATGAGRVGFAAAQWEGLKAVALAGLADWHRRSPNAIGPSEERLFVGTALRLAREAAVAVAAELIADGVVIREPAGIRLASHRPTLSPADTALWDRVAPHFDQHSLRPPAVAELAASLGVDAKKLEALLVRVMRLGLLVRLTPNRFIRPEMLRRLGEMAAELAAQSPDRSVTAAAFRTQTGVGRNLAVDLLEHFDRVKLTRRVGDTHEIIRPVEEALGKGGP